MPKDISIHAMRTTLQRRFGFHADEMATLFPTDDDIRKAYAEAQSLLASADDEDDRPDAKEDDAVLGEDEQRVLATVKADAEEHKSKANLRRFDRASRAAKRTGNPLAVSKEDVKAALDALEKMD